VKGIQVLERLPQMLDIFWSQSGANIKIPSEESRAMKDSCEASDHHKIDARISQPPE
jgi:hypothetical protein